MTDDHAARRTRSPRHAAAAQTGTKRLVRSSRHTLHTTLHMARKRSMSRGSRRVVCRSLFVLALAARVNPTSSLFHRVFLSPSAIATTPAPSRSYAATNAYTATGGSSNRRRRARPTWHGHNSRLLPPLVGSSRWTGSAGLAAAAEAAAGAEQDGVPTAAATLPPLTHEQLPEESIYLLDGTSMLFRAFYGRGAGG